MPPGLWLVCFAVKEEAAPFRALVRNRSDIEVLVTGMGPRNAESGLRAALAVGKPRRVLTCGFAGGLDPALKPGDLVSENLGALGARCANSAIREVRFHCAARVASTAREKSALRVATGADAVEMESSSIHRACVAAEVPCVTVRVILDTAEEDLPLDFNVLLNARQELDPLKLGGALLRNPGKVPDLIRFQKRVKECATALANALQELIG